MRANLPERRYSVFIFLISHLPSQFWFPEPGSWCLGRVASVASGEPIGRSTDTTRRSRQNLQDTLKFNSVAIRLTLKQEDTT